MNKFSLQRFISELEPLINIDSGFGAFDEVIAGDELTELLEKTAVFYEEILTEYGMM